MDHKLILKVYDLINKNVNNPAGMNGSIAKELNEKYFLEPSDLANTLIIRLIEQVKILKEKGKTIPDKTNKELQGWTSIFVRNALLNIKKSEEARVDKETQVRNYGWGKENK